MSMPAVWREFSWDYAASPYSKVAGQTWQFKACLRSDRYESDQQKSLTCHWGSLAQVSSIATFKFSWQYNLLILTYKFPIQSAKLRLTAYLSLSPSGCQ